MSAGATDRRATCAASGEALPADARADYEADPTCTHFWCPGCGKLLRLPRDPAGAIRRHKPETAEGEPWPFATAQAAQAPAQAAQATHAAPELLQ